MKIKRLPPQTTCPWLGTELFPNHVCPILYHTLYPYFLALLYGAKFTFNEQGDCNVYSCWRGWGKPELSYGNLKDDLFGEIWRRRNRIEQVILTTPPEGSECKVCNIWKLNTILHDINHASGWKDILL